jgi:S-adenosylmethionine:tRNA ribosyltransferase-isomerase
VKTSEFDYDLPPELIAQHPLVDRAASRMMVVDRSTGDIRHEDFRNLGRHLGPGDLLVLNDTKVVPARIWAKQPAVELLLVERLDATRWSALVKPGRKAEAGATLTFESGSLVATVEEPTEFGGRVLRFTGDVEAYMEQFGAAPLPPYIKHPGLAAADRDRYQTIYARQAGAIAAPTAGLHFTRDLLDQWQQAGVGHAFVTLHVGIGTFRPVKVENVEEHKMHAERFSVSEEAARSMQNAKRIIAVGTTVARTLETIGEPRATEGQTEIFIYPPYEFKVVDALLTNFHLPRSSLLMLVCAFASREIMLKAYREAVRERYRFFSYGDCTLIL